MYKNVYKSTETQEFSQPTAMTSIALDTSNYAYTKGISIQLDVNVTTPSASTFTAAVTDICTDVAHGFKTGLAVQLTTTTTLPAGLSLATTYYVIVLDADTFKLATSLVNANAGTAIDITSTGTGTHTSTPTAISGCSMLIQGCNDNTNWVDLTNSAVITASEDFLIEQSEPAYQYIQVYFNITSGQISVTQKTLIKGL